MKTEYLQLMTYILSCCPAGAFAKHNIEVLSSRSFLVLVSRHCSDEPPCQKKTIDLSDKNVHQQYQLEALTGPCEALEGGRGRVGYQEHTKDGSSSQRPGGLKC